MKVLLTIAVLLLLTTSIQAWWCTGHMTVAWIAKQQMSKTAYENVNAIAQKLSSAGPFPKSPDFVQMACWADDLKSYGLVPMAGWHFINQVYDPTKFPVAKWPVQRENVETLIAQLDEALKKHSSPDWDIQFALANLVHFYGDIHQPLHATELFSSTYPQGDKGGNEQSVTVDNTKTRLHFIWDSICWEYNTELNRPLDSTDYGTVQQFGKYLMNTYGSTFSSQQINDYNSTDFATESFNDAVKYAYPGTYNGMTISSQYLATCKPVAEGRVALAGYRLGTQLEYLFGKSKIETDDHKRALAKKIRDHIVRSHVEIGNIRHTQGDKIDARIRKAL